MSFFPSQLDLVLHAKLENGRVRVLDRSFAVMKYLAVGGVTPSPHPERVEGRAIPRSREVGHDKGKARSTKHTFSVESVYRLDQQARLDPRPWTLLDKGTLEKKPPDSPCADQAERRLVELSFDGAVLAQLEDCDSPDPNFYEALAEQALIGLRISIDAKVISTLAIKPLLRFQ